MARIADTSPYVYLATFFFVLSACSSDLLFLRFSLTFGFLFLVLASLTGHATDGSFTDMPLADGIVDLTMLVNIVLFGLNCFICARLIGDECPRQTLSEQEQALFRFFQSRCGLTQLQFQSILDHGHFLELPAHTAVPDCQSGCTLYLVLQGKVSCHAKFNNNLFGKTFVKRSGQFFDIKLFNLFTIPVGFDAKEFHAKTVTRTKFFCWELEGLIAMRDLQSPNLKPYWEYIVLRSLAGIAVQHHLNAQDTLYDSLLVPEHKSWLDGAPSRDFWKQEKPVGNWKHVKRQLGIIRNSLWHIIPPHGVRHQPGIVTANPKQAYMELVCKAAATDREAPCFPNALHTNDETPVVEEEEDEERTAFTFLAHKRSKRGADIQSE